MSVGDADDLAPTEGLQTRSDLAAGVPEGVLAPGTVLGRYRIETVLGRGGMGEVYRAEQLQPVRRTVALKRLHLRRVDARQLAHFEVERQLLAHMRHPAIAQIFDAGTTDDGHPFFAMEFIEGEPITAYCERHGLSLSERLAVFIRVCEGVQHAHQKGVVHRDLKPGNILVTEVDGRPVPKVIDFGIATAAERSGRDAPLDRAGTPDYMSPEQAGLEGGIEIDTRSDVYSLGVLLYELIAGQRPGAGVATSQALHTADDTPVPPSRQFDTLPSAAAEARARQLRLRRPQLRRLLRSELDWVVLKAMRRDRNQRYPSASALAADLQRFLEDRPLEAVPAHRRYVWRKYIARHRWAATSAAAVSLALLVGLGLSLYGLHEARQQRAIAERRSDELEKVAAFQQSMLEGVDIEAMGIGLTDGLREQMQQNAPERLPQLDAVLAKASTADIARQAIDRHLLANALAAIDRDFAAQPALAERLRLSVGEVQLALGLAAPAAEVFKAVATQREARLGADALETLAADGLWAQAELEAGRQDESRALAEATLARLEAMPPPTGTDAARWRDLRLEAGRTRAIAMFNLGEREEARAAQQAMYAREESIRADDDLALLNLQGDLALSMARMGDIAEARRIHEDLYARMREVRGPEDGRTLVVMGRLAVMRDMDGDADAAVALQTERVALGERKLGAEHPFILNERGNLANMLLNAHRIDEAEPLMREVLDARARLFGDDAPVTVRTRLNLAALLARDGRADEALALEEAVLASRRRDPGPRHPDTAFVEVNHATTLHRAGRPPAEVQAQIDRAAPLAHEVLGDKHPQTRAIDRVQGFTWLRAGQYALAAARFEQLRDAAQAERKPDDVPDATLGWALAEALQRLGREDEAAAIFASDVQWLHDIPTAQRSEEEMSELAQIEEERQRLPSAPMVAR